MRTNLSFQVLRFANLDLMLFHRLGVANQHFLLGLGFANKFAAYCLQFFQDLGSADLYHLHLLFSEFRVWGLPAIIFVLTIWGS